MNYELNIKIEEQQKKYAAVSAVYAVGEQLKEICERYSGAAELVLHDLDNEEMSIAKCEAKIKEYADALHKENKGTSVCVPYKKAEEIICKFYGINRESSAAGVVSLTDVL